MIDGLSHDEGGASWRSEEIERNKMLFYYYWYGPTSLHCCLHTHGYTRKVHRRKKKLVAGRRKNGRYLVDDVLYSTLYYSYLYLSYHSI